jgi:very-short-patch-repair endonuclease
MICPAKTESKGTVAANFRPFPFRGGIVSYRHLRNIVQPRIKKFAKRLRKHQTSCETLLWEHLRGRKLFGLRFGRQRIIRGYIADFYCPEKRVAIEIDGPTHNPAKDAVRDSRILRDCRITVLRFSNAAVKNDVRQVLETIASRCGLDGFPTIPQDSSSQESNSNIQKPCDDKSFYPCGNKGKLTKALEVGRLIEIGCGKRCGPAWKNGEACPEQVFATEEAAQDTARSFKEHFGGTYFVGRCSRCGLLHLKRGENASV